MSMPGSGNQRQGMGCSKTNIRSLLKLDALTDPAHSAYETVCASSPDNGVDRYIIVRLLANFVLNLRQDFSSVRLSTVLSVTF
jgi:hypothetical protein